MGFFDLLKGTSKMKVSAITNRNYAQQQNFKGLHRVVKDFKDETIYEPLSGVRIGSYIVKKTIYYYPYSDESQTVVDDFVKARTNRIETAPLNPYLSDQTTKITQTVVEVQPRLPFTKQDYNDYVEDMQINEEVFLENKDMPREALMNLLVSKKSAQTEKALIEAGLKDWIV